MLFQGSSNTHDQCGLVKQIFALALAKELQYKKMILLRLKDSWFFVFPLLNTTQAQVNGTDHYKDTKRSAEPAE
jgi:hypothetical protein